MYKSATATVRLIVANRQASKKSNNCPLFGSPKY